MYQYKATLSRVIDGDTVDLDVDLGFGVSMLVRFRLAGLDAPEARGPEKEAGRLSKDALTGMLSLAKSDVCKVDGREKKHVIVDSKGTDKYGRWIANLSIVTDDGSIISINDRMINEGFAVAKEY